jgi:hypothetical protein
MVQEQEKKSSSSDIESPVAVVTKPISKPVVVESVAPVIKVPETFTNDSDNEEEVVQPKKVVKPKEVVVKDEVVKDEVETEVIEKETAVVAEEVEAPKKKVIKKIVKKVV